MIVASARRLLRFSILSELAFLPFHMLGISVTHASQIMDDNHQDGWETQYAPPNAEPIIIDGETRGWLLGPAPDPEDGFIRNLFVVERPIRRDEIDPCEPGPTIQSVVSRNTFGEYTEYPFIISPSHADYIFRLSKHEKSCFGILSGRTWEALHLGTVIPRPYPRYIAGLPIHGLYVPDTKFVRAGIEFAVDRTQCQRGSTQLEALAVIHQDMVARYRSQLTTYLAHAILELARHCGLPINSDISVYVNFYVTDSKVFVDLPADNLLALAEHYGEEGYLMLFLDGEEPQEYRIAMSLAEHKERLRADVGQVIDEAMALAGLLAPLAGGGRAIGGRVSRPARSARPIAPARVFRPGQAGPLPRPPMPRSVVRMPPPSKISQRGLYITAVPSHQGVLRIRLHPGTSRFAIAPAGESKLLVRPAAGNIPFTIVPPRGTAEVIFEFGQPTRRKFVRITPPMAKTEVYRILEVESSP